MRRIVTPPFTLSILFLLAFVSACTPASGMYTTLRTPTPTLTKHPTESPASTSTAKATSFDQRLTPSPVIEPGTFADFDSFASEIARALHQKNLSFFSDRSLPSGWNCLGDEIYGVCQGQPTGTVLSGIPVSQDWHSYRLYTPTGYADTLKESFAQGLPLALHAISHQYGDNPLMPMAAESFQAIVTGAQAIGESRADHVRVLYFEYHDGAWWLQGELNTADQAEGWLFGNCGGCFDEWKPWVD